MAVMSEQWSLNLDQKNNTLGDVVYPGATDSVLRGKVDSSGTTGQASVAAEKEQTTLFGIPVSSTALMGLGVGFQAGSAIAQGYSDYTMSKFNAAQYTNQAAIVAINARNQENDFRRKAANLMGQQTVGYAAAGVRGGTGTVQDVALDTRFQLEQDALRIKYSGLIQENSLRMQAAMAKIKGKQSLFNSTLKAFGSFFEGYYKTSSWGNRSPGTTDTTLKPVSDGIDYFNGMELLKINGWHSADWAKNNLSKF